MTACLEELLEHWPGVVLFISCSRRPQQYQNSSVHPHSLDGQIVKDVLFPIRLSLFEGVLREFVYRFQKSLTSSVDGNFYLFGQVARYIYSLASQCIVPHQIPPATSWDELLQLDLGRCEKIPAADFGAGTDFRLRLVSSRYPHPTEFSEQARDF